MFDEVADIICGYAKVPKESITPETNVLTGLNLTSMDFMEMICEFEEKFGHEVPERDFGKLVMIKDIVEYIDANSISEEIK